MNQNANLPSNFPELEIIDVQLNSASTFNPTIEFNQQCQCKEDCDQICPLIHTCTFDHILHRSIKTEPPDPLDLSEMKIEPNILPFDYNFGIKIEKKDLKQEACDVGDHNYAAISIIEHSYAKRYEEHLQDIRNIEDSLKNQVDSSNKIKTEVKIVANKKNCIVNKFEDIHKENQEKKCNWSKATKNQPEVSENNIKNKHKWQVDLQMISGETYLKESNVPVDNDFPIKPLEAVPVIDLSDSSNSEADGENSFDDKTGILEQVAATKIDLPEIHIRQKHMKSHNLEKAYECNDCAYKTTYKWKLIEHMRTHLRDKQKKYSHYRYKWKLYENASVHTSELPFKCTECVYRGKCISYLIKHQQVHVNLLPYMCKVCHFRTKTEESLIRHKEIHESPLNGPLDCCLCGISTGETLIMENHMVKHAKMRTYRCYQCDYVTWYYHELNVRKRSHSETVQCDVCYEKMSNEAFQAHKKIHMVKCNECQFVAASDGALKAHMKNVHIVTNFRCASCDYYTNAKKKLLFHMVKHMREKPYKCVKCSYTAITSSHVRIHMRSHANNMPYKCTRCLYTTPSSFELLAHMDSHTEKLLPKYENLSEKSNKKRLYTTVMTKDQQKLKNKNEQDGFLLQNL